jgi:secondary thiamine-phosphate synthase enzyme
MRSHQAEIRIQGNGAAGFVDITERIQETIADARIVHGRATVSGGDPSCALVVNEKETGLITDVRSAIERLGATDDAAPTIGSGSVVVPIVEGKLRLGTWQRILLIELNGSSDRTIGVHLIGE